MCIRHGANKNSCSCVTYFEHYSDLKEDAQFWHIYETNMSYAWLLKWPLKPNTPTDLYKWYIVLLDFQFQLFDFTLSSVYAYKCLF